VAGRHPGGIAAVGREAGRAPACALRAPHPDTVAFPHSPASGEMAMQLMLMLLLAVLGLALLLGSPWVVPRVTPGEGDRTGMVRLLQAAGIVLLLLALLARPHTPGVSAFPTPPDAEASR